MSYCDDVSTYSVIIKSVNGNNSTSKWWGCKESPPAFALHGILDNANSFDNLLPLIDYPSVLCIDLPGHGQSSHLPRGPHIHYPDYITLLRYIIKYYYKQEKTTLIGHSYGGSLCTAYSGIFPEGVDKLVSIECSRLITAIKIDKTIRDFRKPIEDFLSFEESKRQPEGRSMDDRVNHLYKVRKQIEMPMSKESCRIILERATNPIQNNLRVNSFDPRLQFRTLDRFTKEMCLSYAKRLTMDVLSIMCRNGFYAISPNIITFNADEMEMSIKDIENVSKRAVFKIVDGYHHAIMDEPEEMAKIINDFLNYL